jgi:serine/threonine-protein kinase
VPYIAVMGVRSWAAVLPPFVMVLIAAGISRHALSRKTTGLPYALGMSISSTLCIIGLSCWLGPFVLVPVAAAINTIVFVLHSKGRERWIHMALGTLAAAVPFVVEALGVFPPAWAFRDGNLVLLSRAVMFPKALTVFALVYTSVMFTTLPAIFLSRIRDALNDAERQQFLHAWHLKRLVEK